MYLCSGLGEIAFADNIIAGKLVNPGFESGFNGFEIYRYPRYSHLVGEVPDLPELIQKNAISGNYSLLLPGLKDGGYRLNFQTILLNQGVNNVLSVKYSSKGKAVIALDVSSGNYRYKTIKKKIKPGTGTIYMKFDSYTSNKNKNSDLANALVLRIESKFDLVLDEFHIQTKNENAIIYDDYVGLDYDKAIGVYDVSDAGKMYVRGLLKGKNYKYVIENPLYNSIVAEGDISTTLIKYKVPLYTKLRGFYELKIYSDKGIPVANKYYSVIKPTILGLSERRRYGIAMEEHGNRTQINARVLPYELYELSKKIGVGSVRLFSLAMPDLVSKDGIKYKFYQLDQALSLAEKFQLEPLVEMGSNLVERIPHWMRKLEEDSSTIDLTEGLKNRFRLKKLERQRRGLYFNLLSYEKYLQQVFEHLHASPARYFEIWNEPGHKFTVDSFSRIAKLTREKQKQYYSAAKLVGATSTKGKGQGQGADKSKFPRFIEEVLQKNGANKIDVLSYHSEHAYKFYGKNVKHNDDETDYVDRLKHLLKKYSMLNAEIWDTERGMAWDSLHESRIDKFKDSKALQGGFRKQSPYDVAYRLPIIFAASIADGVERLFWFHLTSSTSTISRSHARFGMFDANMEPMPHLPVYNAMTEIIRNAKFDRIIETKGGTRIYVFQRADAVIALIANRTSKSEKLLISSSGKKYELFDVMGNIITTPYSNKIITVTGNVIPQYFVMYDAKANDFKL